MKRGLTSALSQASFAAADVPDYSEALLQLAEFKPDMVIMNKEPLSVDGWTAYPQLHQALDVAIILISKDSSNEALDSTLPYSEHLGATCGAYTLSRWLSVLHRDRLRIPHFLFGTALHAICFH